MKCCLFYRVLPCNLDISNLLCFLSLFALISHCQVAAVANQFVIRHVDPDSSDFLYSANLWEVREGSPVHKLGKAVIYWVVDWPASWLGRHEQRQLSSLCHCVAGWLHAGSRKTWVVEQGAGPSRLPRNLRSSSGAQPLLHQVGWWMYHQHW
jgi:hypothetical protein